MLIYISEQSRQRAIQEDQRAPGAALDLNRPVSTWIPVTNVRPQSPVAVQQFAKLVGVA